MLGPDHALPPRDWLTSLFASPAIGSAARRSQRVEGYADAILTVFHARRDMMPAELQAELVERGLRFGYGTLRRFFARRSHARK